MARSKTPIKPASRLSQSAPAGRQSPPPPTVSGRWLVTAIATAIAAAGFCAWAVLCLLFWQGSWQLLYHPSAKVVRTPQSTGLAYDAVGFAATQTGAQQLQGWWIPAGASARYTVLYLHGRTGNLGDTLDDLARLHSTNVNVFAFDYRGYGQSQFVHPSESRWRQDADWALLYLAATRHIDPHATVIVGSGLGANLALEVAAAHPELAGVVLESPLDEPAGIIFGDARAKLVPARLLVRDRWGMMAPAADLHIPSLWLMQNPRQPESGSHEIAAALEKITATKTLVPQPPSSASQQNFTEAFEHWLGDLHP